LIDVVVAELQEHNIAYPMEDTDSFKDEYFLGVAHCVAWAAAPEFGRSTNAALAALKQRAEDDMKDFDIRQNSDKRRRTLRSDFPISRRVVLNSTTSGN